VVTLPYELASDAVRSGTHFYPVISELEDIKRRKCDLGKYGDYIEADCPAEALHASGAFVNGVSVVAPVGGPRKARKRYGGHAEGFADGPGNVSTP
jgi:hypothetical protein